MKKSIICCVVFLFVAGCGIHYPRARLGALPTNTAMVPFPNPEKLGTHGYFMGFGEVNGLVYTCRGGHIDIYHLRGCADNTRYLSKKVRSTIAKGKKGFSYNLEMETSRHHISFVYPDEWDSFSEKKKQKIADEVFVDVGQYIAFNASVWHEILTWFGVHFAGFEPEFNSAFSWEDVYSNLIGSRLAAQILKDDMDDVYDLEMTRLIDAELEHLGAVPVKVARAASQKMYGDWYTGNLIPNMKMRNFDIGLDGEITPTLIPDVTACGAEPQNYPAPSLAVLEKYGIEMIYRISPNVFEQGRIFKAAGQKKIYQQRDFPVFLEYMKAAAAKRGDKYDE